MIDYMILGLLIGTGYLAIEAGQALLSACIGLILGVLLSDALRSVIQYLLE